MASTHSRRKARCVLVVALLLAMLMAAVFGARSLAPDGTWPWSSASTDESHSEEEGAGTGCDEGAECDSSSKLDSAREEAKSQGEDLGWQADVRMGNPVSHDAEGDVAQAASAELERYKRRGDCVLCQAGYLDLLGGVWGCLVQGPGWVEMCVVEEHEGGAHSTVRTVRMEEEEWGQRDAGE